MMAQAALRDRQVELTRDLISEAQAGLVADGLLAEFAVHDAADRAGTSLRTVYLPATEPHRTGRSRDVGSMATAARGRQQ